MSLISTWSTIANDNGTLGSTPFYWPEGQAPSTVNNCARQMMATIRDQWNDAQWFNWGYTVTRVSGNSFSVVTSSANTVTIANVFQTSGRLKLYDTSTLYGTITTVSVSAASVLVSFTPDANSLTASFSSVFNSIITPDLKALPPGGSLPADVVRQSTSQLYGADGGATDAYAISMSPTVASLGTGQLINFKANTANTGAATLNVDGLGPVPILKNGTTPVDTNDILAGQIVSVIYDGTNFQMQSQVGNAAAITGGRLVSTQVLTSGSGATYTKPGGINMLVVEMVGGGAGGQGSLTTGAAFSPGGGGGSGAYCRKVITAPSVTYTYTIGSGGAGGAGGAGGSNGAATTFGVLSAGGGLGSTTVSGGINANSFGGDAGFGGTASGGDINQPGNPGGVGWALTNGCVSGYGGASYFGASPQGINTTFVGSANGVSAASNSGAGGSGSGCFGAGLNFSGGNGGSGLIIVYEYS